MVVERIDFVMEVMAGGGWKCCIVEEVVAADSEVCGSVAEVEGWH
jgi:hypothetical protein